MPFVFQGMYSFL